MATERISISLVGAAEFKRKLENLGRREVKNIAQRSTAKVQKIMLAAAKSNARTMVGGAMGASIAAELVTKKMKPRRTRFGTTVMIRPKGGGAASGGWRSAGKWKLESFDYVSKSGKHTYIPAAIEYGHIGPGGSVVNAIPFMRNAADTTKNERLAAMDKEVAAGIDQAIRGAV